MLGKNIWELTELFVNKKALHNKWVYRIKQKANCNKCYKTKLIVMGFQMNKDIDYNDIFSPFIRVITIMLVLFMVTIKNFLLKQMDVKRAFSIVILKKVFIWNNLKTLYLKVICVRTAKKLVWLKTNLKIVLQKIWWVHAWDKIFEMLWRSLLLWQKIHQKLYCSIFYVGDMLITCTYAQEVN